MLVFFLIAAVLVVVFIVVAALSDRRDRKAGIDPKMRTDDVRAHRRELIEELYRHKARRLGYHDPDEDRRPGRDPA